MGDTQTDRRPRLRAIAVGTILIPLQCLFVVQVEVVYASMQATNLSLFYNVVATLALLVAGNAWLRRFVPRWALTAGELRAIGVMLSVATALFGVDMLQIFIGLMPHAHRFATPENRWEQLIWPHLPAYLVVSDPKALADLYLGYSSLYVGGHLQAWLRPMVVWGVFLAGLLAFCLATASLLRRPWAEHERLTFPIIQLPLAMTGGGVLWRSRLCWAGFLIAAALNLSRGLHSWVPGVPLIPQKWEIGSSFVTPPLNAVGWTPVSWYPFAVGLGYLMPLELSFSCWVFYLAWKVQLVFRASLGWGALAGDWIGAQGVGAWIGLGGMALFVTRGELLRTLRAAWRGEVWPGEPMSPRTAWLAVAGGLGVVALVGHRAGLAWSTLAGFFGLYAVLVACIARMRAELGPPSCDLPRGGPDRVLLAFLGPESFGPRQLTLFTLLDWLTYSYRQHPAGHAMEGYQVAVRGGIDRRSMTGLMVWSFIVAYVAWMLIALDAVYRYGFSARIQSYLVGAAGQAYGELAARLQGRPGANRPYEIQFLGGLLFCVGLAALRRQFVFFPLHPVGYAVNGNWTMSHLWFSLFLAWLLKLVLLKAAGLRAYRAGLPFCFGLMLGDCIVGGGQCLLSTYLGAPVRGFFP